MLHIYLFFTVALVIMHSIKFMKFLILFIYYIKYNFYDYFTCSRLPRYALECSALYLWSIILYNKHKLVIIHMDAWKCDSYFLCRPGYLTREIYTIKLLSIIAKKMAVVHFTVILCELKLVLQDYS